MVYFDYKSHNENDLYVESNEEPSPEHQENMLLVLDYYDVAYIEKDGAIYLPLHVWKDKEIIMNYTKKANDAKWLRIQKIKPENE